MKIQTIDTGFLKLDGGAMFGIVPKRLWQKLNPADENNLCTWAMRCLLVETGDRVILFDTGIGDKQDEKFRSHFEPHGEASLINSLKEKAYSPSDITDVFLTHLHFDHVGGAVSRSANGDLLPTFPNARYWTNQVHYDWALKPNSREKASFLKENFVPLMDHGVLNFIPVSEGIQSWLPGIDIRFLYGHTEAMMMPIFQVGNKKVVYAVDLLPSSFHVGMPYVMSYDLRPLLTLEEKAQLYQDLLEQDHVLLFEHDPISEAGVLVKNERGRVVLGDRGSLQAFL